MRRALLAAALLCAGPALGGPWLREEGELFISSVSELTEEDGVRDLWGATYAEWGARPGLTLGAKYGRATATESGETYGFLRVAVPVTPPYRVAAELGLGHRTDDAGRGEPLLRPGRSWGRGLTALGRPGWVSLDAAAEIGLDTGNRASKIEITLGLNPDDRSHAILQLRRDGDDEYSDWVLAPSYVRRATKRMDLQIGGIWSPDDEGKRGLLAGTWFTF